MAKTQKKTASRGRSRQERPQTQAPELPFSLGGVLGKFGGFLDKLAELAETGQELSRTGELTGLDREGKLRGVYGFSVKTAIGDQGGRELKIEPFGNVRQEPSGETVLDEVREPLVDVHEEDDHVLVLAEIPGVGKQDVQLDLAKDRLVVRAQRGEKRYHKEVVLPGDFSAEKMGWECKNGLLKIRLGR
jgi:HSP20 family protein